MKPHDPNLSRVLLSFFFLLTFSLGYASSAIGDPGCEYSSDLPVMEDDECDFELGTPVVECMTGDLESGDSYTVTIPYTGILPGAQLTTGGDDGCFNDFITLSGNDPAITADGAIVLTTLEWPYTSCWSLRVVSENCGVDVTVSGPSERCYPECYFQMTSSGTKECLTTTDDADLYTVAIEFWGTLPDAVITAGNDDECTNGSITISGDDPTTTSHGEIILTSTEAITCWSLKVVSESCGVEKTSFGIPPACGIQCNVEFGEPEYQCLYENTGSDATYRVHIPYTGSLEQAVVTAGSDECITDFLFYDPAEWRYAELVLSVPQSSPCWSVNVSSAYCDVDISLSGTSPECLPICDFELGEPEVKCWIDYTLFEYDVVIPYTGRLTDAVLSAGTDDECSNGFIAISGDNPITKADGKIRLRTLESPFTSCWSLRITSEDCGVDTIIHGLSPTADCTYESSFMLSTANFEFLDEFQYRVTLPYFGTFPGAVLTAGSDGFCTNEFIEIGGDDPGTTPNGEITLTTYQSAPCWSIFISSPESDMVFMQGGSSPIFQCEADAGTISFLNSDSAMTYCVDDSLPSTIDVFVEESEPTSTLSTYWVATDPNSTIIAFTNNPNTVASFNLDTWGIGTYFLYRLQFDPDASNAVQLRNDFLSGEVININDLTGCFDKSNFLILIGVSCSQELHRGMEGSTSIDQNDFLSVSPNPTDEGEITLSFRISEPGPTRIDLYDSSGRLIQNLYDASTADGDVHTFGIDINNLPVGTYFCRLTSPTAVTGTKLLISR